MEKGDLVAGVFDDAEAGEAGAWVDAKYASHATPYMQSCKVIGVSGAIYKEGRSSDLPPVQTSSAAYCITEQTRCEYFFLT